MNNIELIKGLSGCKLDIRKKNGFFIVNKSTNDVDYLNRLERQCFKQKQYRGLISKECNILVPKVTYENRSNTLFEFEMEYLPARDTLTFLENSKIEEINYFVKNIFRIIDINIELSTYKVIEKKIFFKKIDKIRQAIDSRPIVKMFAEYFELVTEQIEELENDLLIPVGVCHGDLTFSNILMKDNKIILIDFLDSYLETPLQDIVKIRQDTAHFWSLKVIDKKIDKIKIKIILEYIDRKITKHYQGKDFMQYYNIFQVINLLRILPYTQDKELLKVLKNEISRIYRRK